MRARFAFGFLLSVVCGSALAQTASKLVNLGTLGGDFTSTASFVNDKGMVVGMSSRTNANDGSSDSVFAWTATGGMIDIFTSNPTIDSAAVSSRSVVAVTSGGQVFGSYSVLKLGVFTPQAFAWNASGGLVGLGTLEGTTTVIHAVSDNGQAVGQSGNRAFSWTAAGGLVDLGLLGPPFNWLRASASAVSKNGQFVVGSGTDQLGSVKGFLWTATGGPVDIGYCQPTQVNDNGEMTGRCGVPPNPSAAFFRNSAGAMFDLGAGQASVGAFLNKSGEVAGSTPTWSFFWSSASGAVLPDGTGVLAEDVIGLTDDGLMAGMATTLGGLQYTFVSQGGAPLALLKLGAGGTYSSAGAVSAGGQVVGTSQIPSDFRGFSWTSTGGIHEMPTLGGLASYANGVNGRGQVIGQATLPNACVGNLHSVLWNTVPVPKTPLSVTIPDINSDGVADIGVMRDTPLRVEVRSGQNGALLGVIPLLDLAATPLAIRALPDSDGNGIPEIAVLSARNSDGRGVVQIHDVTGSQPTRQIWFAIGFTPVSMAVAASDADKNGVPELAVLSTRNTDGRGLVDVRNAFGTVNRNFFWVGAGLAPSNIEIVEDADKNGVPEAAVLSTRAADGQVLVEVMNVYGTLNRNVIGFMACNTAIDLAIVNDSDGNTVPEVAVLSTRFSDGRNVVEVKNAAGPRIPRALWFAAGFNALSVKQVADADHNGVPEIAVYSTRKIDGRVLVQVKNAAGVANLNSIWFPAGFSAGDFMIPGDLDGNGIDEATVLLVRNSDGRMLLQSRNAAGAPAIKNYWLSP